MQYPIWFQLASIVVILGGLSAINHVIVTVHERTHARVAAWLGYQLRVSYGYLELDVPFLPALVLPVRSAGACHHQPFEQLMRMGRWELIAIALSPIWMFLVAVPGLVAITSVASIPAGPMLIFALLMLGPSPWDWYMAGRVLYEGVDVERRVEAHTAAEGISIEVSK